MATPLSQDRGRAESFGADPERYDRCRPSYPPALIEWLSVAEGGAGTAVDVGCGSGKVAVLLRDAGWDVIGVEPDERMATYARRRGIRVDVARFEDWVPSVRDVDVVCSGQAWHWVDRAAGQRKAAEILRSGGRIAVFWNLYSYEPNVAAVITEVYRRLAPELLDDSVALGRQKQTNNTADLTALELSPDFHEIEFRSFEHSRPQTVLEWLDELRSHALHHHVERQRTDAIFAALEEELGTATDGSLTAHYETVVTTATRA